MKNKFSGAIAIVIILLIVSFFYHSAAVSSRTGEDTPRYSVRRHDPYGVAALHDLLVERGATVRTLETPDLDDDDHGALIQVLSDSDSPEWNAHSRTQPLLDWISRGNLVIQLTRSSTDLLQTLKISPTTMPSKIQLRDLSDFENAGGDPENTPASETTADTTVAGNPQLSLWSPMSFGDQPGTRWKTIARTSTGSHDAVAGEISIGKGKLIVVGAPTPAVNGTVGSAGNLDFLLALIGNNPVIFDEWSHGIGHEHTLIGFLRDVGLLPLLLQVALVAGLYAWSTSGHGAVSDVPKRATRSSIEQIETLGHLYSRSLGPLATFERVNQEVLHRFASVLRCQPNELVSRLQTLEPELRGRIEQVITQLSGLRPTEGIPCVSCGYDLRFNQSGKCPECGSPLRIESLRKLKEHTTSEEGGSPADAAGTPRPNRLNSGLASLLSLSHQLSLEVKRERRYVR